MDIDTERIARSPFVIGALGALVSLRFAPGDNWRERLFNFLCGVLIAGYVAPAAVDWLHLQTPALANATAFAIGMLGMAWVAAVLQGIKALPLSEIVTSWLSRKG